MPVFCFSVEQGLQRDGSQLIVVCTVLLKSLNLSLCPSRQFRLCCSNRQSKTPVTQKSEDVCLLVPRGSRTALCSLQSLRLTTQTDVPVRTKVLQREWSRMAVKGSGKPRGARTWSPPTQRSQDVLLLCVRMQSYCVSAQWETPKSSMSSTDDHLTGQHLKFGGFHIKSWDFSFFGKNWKLWQYWTHVLTQKHIEAEWQLGQPFKRTCAYLAVTYLYHLLGRCRPGVRDNQYRTFKNALCFYTGRPSHLDLLTAK